MNWYKTLKEMEKQAGWFDGLMGKKPGGLSGSPIVQPGAGGRMNIQTPQYSADAARLRQQLRDCEMRVNRLKNEIKSNPALQVELQQAIAAHQQALDQLSQQHDKEYA